MRASVHHERRPNTHYPLADGVFFVLVGLPGGARSLSQCLVLWSDGVLRQTAGWVRIPDESTVGRRFKEVTGRHISELESLVHEAHKRVWRRALREVEVQWPCVG